MLNRIFALAVLLFLISLPVLAQKDRMLEDFKAMVEKGAWFEAEEMAEVLEIYYQQDKDFQNLRGKVRREIASMPLTRRLMTRYRSTSLGLVFVGILSLIFYSVALRKGN